MLLLGDIRRGNHRELVQYTQFYYGTLQFPPPLTNQPRKQADLLSFFLHLS
jgi:hypothetical protein